MFYVETNVDYSDTQGLFNQTFTSVAIVFRLLSRTAPSWLVSSVGRALQRYRRGQGFESRTSLNFFRLSFPNYKSCVYNRDDLLSYNSSLRSSHIWFSYIHNFIIILSRVYNEPIQRPAPSWLVSLIGKALHQYRRGQGFESRTSLNFFSGFLFATAKVAYITAMIILHLILHSAVHIYDFHIFKTSSSSFHRFIMNQFNDLLPVGLLA